MDIWQFLYLDSVLIENRYGTGSSKSVFIVQLHNFLHNAFQRQQNLTFHTAVVYAADEALHVENERGTTYGNSLTDTVLSVLVSRTKQFPTNPRNTWQQKIGELNIMPYTVEQVHPCS